MLCPSLVLSVSVLLLCSVSAQVVQIKQGSLRGVTNTSRSGRQYFGFLGVPYAAPPVNALRFQEPQPHAGWEGERDATHMREMCPQPTFTIPKGSTGEEDCLFLNIYTPKIDAGVKLPVMVYIHGGAFRMGASNFYKGKYMMDENVVLVVINYRLGVLGFMTFGDEVIPANLGLKDQVSALQWVRENIVHFGGDPNSVTIFGCSAGGASVDFHILSPLSEGLFQNAIIESGTALCPWAITPQNIAKQRAEAVATLLGCPSNPPSEALACMKDISADLLVTTGEKFEEWSFTPIVSFAPVIDNYMYDKAFLPDHPLKLTPHKVNLIIGLNTHEGNLVAVPVCINDFKLARELEADVSRKLPLWTMLTDHVANKDKKKISSDIMKFYMKGETINEKTVGTDFENLIKDFLFSHCTYKTALHYHKRIPVYLYLNDVPVEQKVDFLGKCEYTQGPDHAEESIFFFDDIYSDFTNQTTPLSETDEKNSRRFIKLWTTFAVTGVPSEKWLPVKSNNLEYLYITTNDMVMKSGLYTPRMKFIDSLPLLVNQYELRPDINDEL